MSEDTVQKSGRVLYIEPTNIKYDDKGNASNALSNNAISNAYENYNMFVELTVERVSRYACGMPDETGRKIVTTYSSSNGTISFMGGTDGYLTTNFTDVDMTSPLSNTRECLGINNISISYDSWMYPKVNIQFVDVRGASLMLPQEENLYNSESTQSGSFFASLFAMPQARFKLTVKGFYGEAVTWSIMPMAPSIKFDAANGNFVIDVEFLADKFASYADIPMPYVLIAPYVAGGKEYWENEKAAGRFVYDNGTNGTVPMYTFPELRLKVAEVSKNADSVNLEKESTEKMSEYTAQIADLDVLIDGFPLKGWKANNPVGEEMCDGKIYTLLNKAGYEADGSYGDGDRKRMKTYYQDILAYNAKYEDKITDFDYMSDEAMAKTVMNITYEKTESTYVPTDTSTTDTAMSNYTLSTIYNNTTVGAEYLAFLFEKNNGKSKDTVPVTMRNLYPDMFPKVSMEEAMDEKFRQYARNEFGTAVADAENVASTNGSSYLIALKISNSECLTPEAGLNRLIKKRNNLLTRKEQEESEYKNRSNAILSNALGFTPTVKNIYKMAFAHLETFMHCYYSYTKNIDSQITGNSDYRKLKSLNDSSITTDVVKRKTDSEMLLPPYPAFYVENMVQGMKKMEEKWAGDFVGGDNLEEVKFIENFMAGAYFFNRESSAVTAQIESYENQNKEESTESGSTPATHGSEIKGFVPITNYDMSHKGNMKNPYWDISSKTFNENDIVPLIAWTFCCRLFYAFCDNKNQSLKFNTDNAYNFGRMEGINLYSALGKDRSDALINFIRTYGQDKSGGSKITNFISYMTSECYKSESVRHYGLSSSDDKEYLFIKSNNNYEYNGDYAYSQGDDGTKTPYFPMYVASIENFRSEVIKNNSTMATNGNYFSTVPNGNSAYTNVLIIEDESYLGNLIDNAKKYVEDVESTIANSNYPSIKPFVTTLIPNTSYESVGVAPYQESEMVVNLKGNGILASKMDEYISKNDTSQIYFKHLGYVGGDGKETKFAMKEPIYTTQETIEAKGYIFLMMLPYQYMNQHLFMTLSSNNRNGRYLKSYLLLEGAHYWRQSFYTDGTFTDPIKCPNGFAQQDKDHLYMKDLRSVDNDLGVYSGDKCFKWKSDDSTLYSRRMRSIKYFTDWCHNEFSAFDDIVTKSIADGVGKKKVFCNSSSKGRAMELNYQLLIGSAGDNYAKKQVAKISDFLKNLLFKVVTVIDPYDRMFSNNSGNAFIPQSIMNNGIKGFLSEISYLYEGFVDSSNGSTADVSNSTSTVDRAAPFKSNDLRLSTYRTMKNLYDKWLCSTPISEWTLEDGGFSQCYFIDSFYHDIGDSLIMNAEKISDWVNQVLPSSMSDITQNTVQYNGFSFFDFLTQIAQTVEATFRQVPLKFGEATPDKVAEMFRAKFTPTSDRSIKSSFLFIYTYKNANKIGNEEYEDDGMNLISSDGKLLQENELCPSLSDEGYTIPAFGVTFAKQNQSIFTNLSLDTTSHAMTEAALEATFNIAAKGSESPRETTLFGQDIYRVYAGYAYECTVEMMGDVQIYPLMHFQLNNIPLFRGVYLIYDVKHEISEGRIMTTFKGNKVNRYAIPFADSNLLIFDAGNATADETEAGTVSSSENPKNSTSVNGGATKADLQDTSMDIEPTPGYKITHASHIDFDTNDITEKKPVICLTPAHGPRTNKTLEWAWSTKLIDDYIIPKLKQYKFKDGTSYATHIQRCNKNGENTGDGYSTKETQDIIKKYGSKKVISAVPHWNGCNGKGNYWLIPTNFSAVGTRADSLKLMNAFKGKVGNFFKDVESGKYPSLPQPFCTTPQNIYVKAYETLKTGSALPIWAQAWGACPETWNGGKKGTNFICEGSADGACRLNCACILTENFFADYNTVGNSGLWATSNYAEKDANGRYKCLRGWLESEEGLNAIAEFHAQAIKAYIDSL